MSTTQRSGRRAASAAEPTNARTGGRADGRNERPIEGGTANRSAALPSSAALPRSAPARCQWCGRELPAVAGARAVGRRRRYCAQPCRQRAYENRRALERGHLPADAVVLSLAEWDDLADRLYQMRCAAEDVATAFAERAPKSEVSTLVGELIRLAALAERIR